MITITDKGERAKIAVPVHLISSPGLTDGFIPIHLLDELHSESLQDIGISC
jgi:hypothetical protein